MSSPGVRANVCNDCHGEGCEGCAFSGRMVDCLSDDCDGTLPLGDPRQTGIDCAETSGAYCSNCRYILDRADDDADREDIRRFARAI